MTAQNHDFPTLRDCDDDELVNCEQDLRGRKLRTRKGESLGTVERMLVDPRAERVVALVFEGGRAVAIEDVEIDANGDAIVERTGTVPPAAVPPAPARKAAAAGATAKGETERVPVVREELAIGKRAVATGAVRIRSRVIEEPVNERVRLREEHVDVDRRPVDTVLSDEDADRLFEDRTVTLTETVEEAVVDKRAHVVEEVVVSKTADEKVADIRDTVRRTEVEVDRAEPDAARDAARRR